jgi:glyoxylase-like metal-dependent hydrolase (beta-lactamase superfamily II)
MRIIDIPLRFARCQLVMADVPTLVDAGGAADTSSVLAVIAREGLSMSQLGRIILTHGDGDHIGGAAELQRLSGAELVAHEDERPYLEGHVPAGFSIVKRMVVAIGSRGPRPHIDRWVTGGEVIDGLEVAHSPGHTPGSICVYAGDAILAGDAFRTGAQFEEVPRLMSADVARSRATIRALARRPVRWAFSGHGPPADGAEARLRSLVQRLRA